MWSKPPRICQARTITTGSCGSSRRGSAIQAELSHCVHETAGRLVRQKSCAGNIQVVLRSQMFCTTCRLADSAEIAESPYSFQANAPVNRAGPDGPCSFVVHDSGTSNYQLALVYYCSCWPSGCISGWSPNCCENTTALENSRMQT